MKKAAVFSCKGLGDGLLCLQLSHNLSKNGYQVDTYHPLVLHQLQEWFPHLPILPIGDKLQVQEILSAYERIFINYDDSSKFIMKLIQEGKKQYPNKVLVINPSVSKKKNQPFYEDAKFSPEICMVKNIKSLCKAVLHLDDVTKSNGIQPPKNFQFCKYARRIIIHPLSAKAGKNWPKEKYLQLADWLKKQGNHPVFVMTPKEKEAFEKDLSDDYEVKSFSNLHDLAGYVYESKSMVGNDSGIGHLASALGLPTVTLFRSCRYANVWIPGWSRAEAVYPSPFYPNISGWRFRDKNWGKLISVKRVLRQCRDGL